VKTTDKKLIRKPRKDWAPPKEAIKNGRTRYLNTIREPGNHVLVTGHSNVKIGRDVRKGALRGYWIYTLSLEERATCPRTCQHWNGCYGNQMPFSKRIKHGPELERVLCANVRKLLRIRGRAGILIRLHALGDFYDVSYVKLWAALLRAHSKLAVYGYTARLPGTPIGDAVAEVKREFGNRFAVRYSDGGKADDCTVSIKEPSQKPPGSFICPEQTGATKACATCALCWTTKKNVAFLEH
jgi:hypothetical protein